MVTPNPQLITESSFHDIRPEMAELVLRRAQENTVITPADAAQIREYIAEHRSCNNVTLGRINKIVFCLVTWRRFIGPFSENTMADLYEGIACVKNGTSARGRPFKQNTIGDLVAVLKQYYRWLNENGYSKIPESKLAKLRIPPRDTMTKVAANLLTPEEIRAMVQSCRRSVDRAVIMTLYEGGFRIGEIGTMKWGDLAFDKYGVVANVNFKTGKPRYIRLIMAREYLATWRADYIGTPEGDALVFVNRQGKPFTHATIHKRLQVIAEQAGITKHIVPHIFRHSRVTHLIKEGVPESVIKLMIWGNITSKMFQTYAHLTGSDIDAAMLQTYGIAEMEDKQAFSRLEPILCPLCKTINSPVSNYCSTCGRSLTAEVIPTQEAMQKDTLNNPELLRALLTELIEEKRKNGSL